MAGEAIGIPLHTGSMYIIIVHADVNCQENPAYYTPTQQESPETPESGRGALATDSVQEREFKKPLYSSNVVTEGRNSALETAAPPNIYDRVDSQQGDVGIGPDPSDSGVYYTVIAT